MSDHARAAAEEFHNGWRLGRGRSKGLYEIIDAAIQAATAELLAENERLTSTRREEIERLVSGTQGEKRSSSVVSMLGGMTRDYVDEVEAERDRLAAQVETLRSAMERMLSPDLDWDNGEVGVGHTFRYIARKALAQAAATPQETNK